MEDAVETAAVKREDQRTREWPRVKGRKDPLSLDGEREKGDRGGRVCERKREGGKERRSRKVERERRKEGARKRNFEKKDKMGTREARKKKRKEEIEREEERERKESKTEGRRRCARGRGKERPEQDSERRQRPFFDKLVTRRHPAAKGAEGSSPAQGGKRRGGRRLSWPKGEGQRGGQVGARRAAQGEEGWVRGGCRVLRRSITA